MDLGSIANFQAGLTGGTYNAAFAGVSAAITSTFGSTAGVYWSVFGVNDTSTSPNNGAVTQADANTVWTSLARSNPSIQTAAPHVGGNSSSQALAVGAIGSIGGIAGSTTPGVISLSAGIATVNTAWTPFIRPLVMRQFPVVSVCCFAATQGSGGRRA